MKTAKKESVSKEEGKKETSKAKLLSAKGEPLSKPKSEGKENLVAIGVFVLLILIGIGIFTKGFDLFEKGTNDANARIRVPLGNDPYTGNPNGSILIIAFSEYECPFCKEAEKTMKKIREMYSDEVVYLFKDFPLTRIHANAYNAALAAECAKEQDMYWEYHDFLYEHNDQLEKQYLKEYANLLGLDTGKFDECLDTEKYKHEVDKDIETGRMAGVTGTPVFFINGIKIIGAKPEQEFVKIISQELK
ncbi:DsbA family protein [Candidatus Woesearchaeota archaeon]|nr:DsbA family protein [Candidatus Woesearchaeota archaeon]